MKKLLSYLWPITKRYSSKINGTLEVTLINGKKVLDTENANYSYGSLQKILEFALREVELSSVENILLLGMGGGSVIKSLRKKFDYQKHLVAIEIDPEIIKIAKAEFGIIESENQHIIQDDAIHYVKNASDIFQLIIIDLFIDSNVAPIIFGAEFCNNLSRILDNNGCIIFNIGINLESDSDKSQAIISHFGKDFDFQKHSKVNGSNTLLIGKKNKYF